MVAVPTEVLIPMQGILTDFGIEQWWITPHPKLRNLTPEHAWVIGEAGRDMVRALIEGYLDPSFS